MQAAGPRTLRSSRLSPVTEGPPPRVRWAPSNQRLREGRIHREANAARPALGQGLEDECRALIHELEDTALSGYDGKLRAPHGAQQTKPVADNGRPYPTARLDVIERPFEFKGGRLVLVRLTRVAFVNLLRAMRQVPSIEVGFGRAAFASLRTFGMQDMFHRNHLNGGPLAAPPGSTWHHRSAIDLGVRSEAGRAAMVHNGFLDLLPQDPPHFTFGRRG